MITSIGMNDLCRALEKNCSITCLNLSSSPGNSRNRLGAEGMKFLGHYLQKTQILFFLNLSGSGVGDSGLPILVDALIEGGKSIISLNIGANCFSFRAVNEIGRMLQYAPYLKEVDLSGNSFGNKLCVVLTMVWKHPLKLQRLHLKDCQITHEGIFELSKAQSQSRDLNQLSLAHNNLYGRGFEHIPQFLLHSHCKLLELSLSYCNLQNDSLIFLSLGLERFSGISSLDLSHNIIHDSGVETLVQSLRAYPQSLKHLDLSYNRIGDSGAKALLKFVKETQFLVSINFAGNLITDEIALYLNIENEELRSLRNVNINDNYIFQYQTY